MGGWGGQGKREVWGVYGLCVFWINCDLGKYVWVIRYNDVWRRSGASLGHQMVGKGHGVCWACRMKELGLLARHQLNIQKKCFKITHTEKFEYSDHAHGFAQISPPRISCWFSHHNSHTVCRACRARFAKLEVKHRDFSFLFFSFCLRTERTEDLVVRVDDRVPRCAWFIHSFI